MKNINLHSSLRNGRREFARKITTVCNLAKIIQKLRESLKFVFTLQCVTVHLVPKFTSCYNVIMVVTGKAHCILMYIMLERMLLSTLRTGWRVSQRNIHYFHYALLIARGLFTLLTAQCNPTMCNRNRVCLQAAIMSLWW